jgi:hypothetical protein
VEQRCWKEELWRRGKLTIKRHRSPSSLCTCSIPLPILSHVRNSNVAIWPYFPQQGLCRVHHLDACREHSLSLTEAADNLNQRPGKLGGVACIRQITPYRGSRRDKFVWTMAQLVFSMDVCAACRSRGRMSLLIDCCARLNHLHVFACPHAFQ